LPVFLFGEHITRVLVNAFASSFQFLEFREISVEW